MNAVKKIDQCVSDLLKVNTVYFGSESSEEISHEYEKTKSESLLQIMLFGSYNAGKSSLINALSASEVAPIDDIPKTATADRYEWNGCYLLDTPGVNAPIEHEELTSEQVDRSELILFVIRQGDQDVKDVYERMFKMLSSGKHVFIVYNHQLSAEELPVALGRLNEILIDYSARFSIDLAKVCNIPVLPINIKTANKARFNGKEVLAEHSGITEFESVFLAWFRQFDSEHHKLDFLKKYINQCLFAPLLSAIEKKLDGESVDGLEDLQDQREQIAKSYSLLNVRIANHIRHEVISIKPEIFAAIDDFSSQTILETTLHQLASKVADSTSEFIQEYSSREDVQLSVVQDIPVDGLDSDKGPSVLGRAVEGALLTGAKSVDTAALKEGLLFLRKMKVPWIKGRWASTLGKWAGKANVVVTLATAAYEIYSASSEQDKINAEQKKQAVGLHQAVEGIANTINSAVLEDARNALKSIESDALGGLDTSIDILIKDKGLHVSNLETIKSTSSYLDSVIV